MHESTGGVDVEDVDSGVVCCDGNSEDVVGEGPDVSGVKEDVFSDVGC